MTGNKMSDIDKGEIAVYHVNTFFTSGTFEMLHWRA